MNIRHVKNTFSSIVVFLGIIGFFTSCADEATGGVKVKPSAMGRLNEIVVIADQDLWDSAVRDTFEYYFESAYPIMPRPEPMFDVRHFTPRELTNEPLRQELRTYVLLVDLSEKDTDAVTMVRTDLGEQRYQEALNGEVNSMVVKDKWARGQIIIYLLGRNKRDLYNTIRMNYPGVSRRVNQHDEEQVQASIYVRGLNPGMSDKIAQNHRFKLAVPAGYVVVPHENEGDFTWIRKDDEESTMNIMISKIEYTDASDFSKDKLIERINELGLYVKSESAGSTKIINDEDLPVYDYTYEIDGNYTKELRGVWEMTGDYIGGPFSSYFIHDKEKNEIIIIDTFVYAPGKSKRDMMQQLEYVIKNGQITKGVENG